MSYQYETSYPAYQEVKTNINCKQRRVLEAIQYLNQFSAVNDRMIAEFVGWPINTITPRRNELAAKGYIVEYCKSKDPETGRKTSFWKVVDKQTSLF